MGSKEWGNAMARNTTGLKRTAGPGRPKGALNKVTREVRQICTSLVDNPTYQARLQQRLLSGKLSPAVEVMLWSYAYGKPKESIEVTGANGEPVSYRFVFGGIATNDTPDD